MSTPSSFSNPRHATLYTPLSSANVGSQWDAIVIGSGIGGMASAAALAKYGRKVLLLEQHYVPGGFTHTFERKGFSWDVGVHCVGEMRDRDVPGKLLKWLTDGGLKMASMGPVYETFHFPGDFKITFPDTWRQFKEQLIERFPNEKPAVEAYFELVWKVSNSAKMFFARRVLPEWMDRAADKLAPDSKKWWRVTTAEVLDGITKDEKLKTVLTGQWGYYGSTPKNSCFAIHALVVRHFWNGGYYPVGGSSSIAENLLKTVADAGGTTVVRASVAEVLVRGGKAIGVKLDDGREFFAKNVISAIGAKATAQHLLPQDFRASAWAKDIAGLNQSPPHVCLYLGFEGDIEKAGATRSNQWFFESWSSEDASWDVCDPKSEAPVLYLSFPSLKDPNHNPGEKLRHTGEVVTFVPWDAFERWSETRRGKRAADYRDFKKDIEERMLAQAKRHKPELFKHLVYHELSTPLSTTFFTRAPMGAIYGLEATPKRFLNSRLRTRTPIKNFYLSGGDVATLGVMGALMGGVLAAGTIDKRVLRHFL